MTTLDIIKKLTLEKQQRIDFNIDEFRMYHLDKPNGNFYNLITFTMEYFENIKILIFLILLKILILLH